MADNTYLIKEGVTITDEVIAIIAGVSALDIDGVDSLFGGLDRDAATKAGAGKIAKCVALDFEGSDTVKIAVTLNVKYGATIPVVCKAVQDKIKSTLESMIGITVSAVDVRIASVAV